MVRNAAILMVLLLAAGPGGARPAPTAAARTAAYLDRIADSPPRLRLFLQAMPKGGDLHNHGGGAIYAEDFLRWAASDGLCIATDSGRIVDPPCDAPNRVPAAGLERDYPRYSRAIDALSTRGFEAGVGDPAMPGYDRFFGTFERFSPAARNHGGEALSLARRQAAADHVAYLELGSGSAVSMQVAAPVANADTGDLAVLMARLGPVLPPAVASVRQEFDATEAKAAALDGCTGAAPQPACGVETRYLYTAIRTVPPAAVFAQLALAFAVAEADPRFVGVNIAAPEHDPVAVRDYALHMRMIGWLHARHPGVALSLHAGELTMGLVPPRDLAFHIDDAVTVAGARRIGHGIDIAYETRAPALLRRMARAGVMVEINLTSNAVILGVKGAAHPLALYREAGVPVALSTDDEGVSRSDMTNEYVRGVTEQHLRYADLKQMARNSLHYAFLPGAGLWQGKPGGARVAACALPDTPACAAFLAANPKAAKAWQLERDFAAFEAIVR
jgi:adenosine deaminase